MREPNVPPFTTPTVESINQYVKANSARVKKTVKAHHHGPLETTREADYKGHHIVVQTRYDVTVDGRPLRGHFVVTDEGQVQYHPLPNYTFLSALDLVKSLIDAFPEDFAGTGHAPHGGHSPGTLSQPKGKAAKTRKRAPSSKKKLIKGVREEPRRRR